MSLFEPIFGVICRRYHASISFGGSLPLSWQIWPRSVTAMYRFGSWGCQTSRITEWCTSWSVAIAVATGLAKANRARDSLSCLVRPEERFACFIFQQLQDLQFD